MRLIFTAVFFSLIHFSHAGTVDTVEIRSNLMKQNFKCVVVKPDNYKKDGEAWPSVYLLHGHGGAFNNWIRRVPELKAFADKYQVLIICPEGTRAGWYMDSPIDSTHRFDTYISKEVPSWIDANYNTIKNRKGRAITGLSMGGHGGLYLGFRHADFFGACGSMSGALVIDFITNGYGVEKILGDTIRNRHYYKEYSIMREMEKYSKDSIAVIMDCGINDFIIEMSRAAHQKMLALKIPHDYIERPGTHNWAYWTNAVDYQLLFFRKYFDRKR